MCKRCSVPCRHPKKQRCCCGGLMVPKMANYSPEHSCSKTRRSSSKSSIPSCLSLLLLRVLCSLVSTYAGFSSFFFFDVLRAFASSSPRVLLQRVRRRHEIFRTVGRTEVLARHAQFAQRTGWTMQGWCNAFACLCQRCRNEAERLEASS